MKQAFCSLNILKGSGVLTKRLGGLSLTSLRRAESLAFATASQQQAFSTLTLLGMGRSKKRNRTEAGLVLAATVSDTTTMSKQQRKMSSTTQENMTGVRFDSMPLSAETKRALDEVLGYSTCTLVQSAALPVCLTGTDVVCKARTGTGKTLAFLIPAVERLKQRPAGRGAVSILVMSPTRELANQIAAEAQELVKFHRLTVQSVVGGTNAATDIRKLGSNAPHILVGTPGRLIDLLENSDLARQLKGVQTLIFDEADRLLDMGFKPSIDKILRLLPAKEARQTVLFSATFPSDIQRLCRDALRPGYKLVDTVGESEVQTAEKVDQFALVSTMNDQLANLVHTILKHQREDKDYKVMVFFTTARLTGMYAELFTEMGIPVLELHSRKSQSHRTKVADMFRSKGRQILFSSDVSARGVDYPDVSLVVQVGLPADKDQYIHRVGRTARAGKQGQAVLLLQDFERGFLNKLNGLPVKQVSPLSSAEVSGYQQQISLAMSKISEQTKTQSYQAWLGFYNSNTKMLNWSTPTLVATANRFAADVLECAEQPGLPRRTAGKMGLSNAPGLRIVTEHGNDFASKKKGNANQGNAKPARAAPSLNGSARDVPPGFRPSPGRGGARAGRGQSRAAGRGVSSGGKRGGFSDGRFTDGAQLDW